MLLVTIPLPRLALPFLLLLGCRAADAGDAAPAGGQAAPPARTASAPNTIAYLAAGGRELRLVAPDGSGDRLVWQLRDTAYRMTAPVWRPDGRELVFSSDHEMAVSPYQRDLYTIGVDGSGLRRITNAPAHAELSPLPKGTVTIEVSNTTMDAGPYFVYVAGAAEPQRTLLPPLRTTRLTFTGVADLGPGVAQPAVAISGIHRWTDAAAAADVQPGRTVAAGPLGVTGFPVEHWGADAPFWSPDGARIGYLLGPTCLVQQIPAAPSTGAAGEPLLDPEVFGPVCALDWAPASVSADPLLVVDMEPYTESGETHILRVAPGAARKPAPVTTFGRYVRVVDLRWLPDGSGFLVARQDDLTDEDANLYEYTFATGALRKLTDLQGEHVRHFSIAPDGRSVVFERVRGSFSDLATLPGDLWIMARDGTGMRPLVRNASDPAWGP